MTRPRNVGPHNEAARHDRIGKATWLVTISALIVLLSAEAALAKITIRPHETYDSFAFHAQYSKDPFDPNDSFTLEIWNCPSGAMPTFVSGRDPIVVCRDDPAVPTPADLVYSVDVPAGACVDHGRSCYYRNSAADMTRSGVRYFRVRYSSPGHGNRVWLESYGDFSAATRANMLLLIKINGSPRAVLVDTFTPLANGGWFSRF